MSAYARIENGQVVARANHPDDTGTWLPVEIVREPIDRLVEIETPENVIESDRVTVIYHKAPRPLADVRRDLEAMIDAEAERRASDVAAPSRAVVYEQKRREAFEAIDDPDPAATLSDGSLKYPLLAASIGVDVPRTSDAASDYRAIASLILTRSREMAAALASIEHARRLLKTSVRNAPDAQSARAVLEAMTWP